jgi:hypothetical protein
MKKTNKNGNPHSSEFPSANWFGFLSAAIAFDHVALAEHEPAVRHRFDGPGFVERRDLAVVDALAHEDEGVAALLPLFDAERRHVHRTGTAVE